MEMVRSCLEYSCANSYNKISTFKYKQNKPVYIRRVNFYIAPAEKTAATPLDDEPRSCIFRMLEIPLIPSWRAPLAFLEFLHSEQIEWAVSSSVSSQPGNTHASYTGPDLHNYKIFASNLHFCTNDICPGSGVCSGWPGVISYLAATSHILSPQLALLAIPSNRTTGIFAPVL